jgi:hypothetical protein
MTEGNAGVALHYDYYKLLEKSPKTVQAMLKALIGIIQ